jgi:predicted metal-dependent phosphoesterase TrpH
VTAPLNIDLHTHSEWSDGALTPAQLIARAKLAGVDRLALTDHDTIGGLEIAQTAAGQMGLDLICGVEISALWRAQTVHVLGLWIDPASLQLRANLAAQTDRRRDRMRRMCERLAKLGLPGPALLQMVENQPGVPTRTHLAAALVAQGHVRTSADAFQRYLGEGKAAYRRAQWPLLSDVLDWIRSAGGKACLAHPMRYRVSSGARRQLICDFVRGGGAALEVVSGNNASQHIETCAELAVKFDLAGSVGSDFHDPKLPWNPLGRLAKLPARVKPLWGDLE